MTSKPGELNKRDSSAQVTAFLDKLDQMPRPHQGDRPGRLIFAMDATASRAATWDMACQLQGDMFAKSSAIGKLELQLVFFRGYQECKSSRWLSNPMDLLRLMSSVSCLAGRTQIERVFNHAIAEVREGQVDALVYVGDSMEENIDKLGSLAGQLKLLGVPLFVFQEGYDVVAASAFKQFAQLSGGAHCQLDQNSARQLGELLNAAAVYAAGGRGALQSYAQLNGGLAKNLLQQLK